MGRMLIENPAKGKPLLAIGILCIIIGIICICGNQIAGITIICFGGLCLIAGKIQHWWWN